CRYLFWQLFDGKSLASLMFGFRKNSSNLGQMKQKKKPEPIKKDKKLEYDDEE
ncbi:22691_t:CDS:1, partial [Gigaspora rosea]